MKWSGWVYAYGASWLDAGADWNEEKVAEFLACFLTDLPPLDRVFLPRS